MYQDPGNMLRWLKKELEDLEMIGG